MQPWLSVGGCWWGEVWGGRVVGVRERGWRPRGKGDSMEVERVRTWKACALDILCVRVVYIRKGDSDESDLEHLARSDSGWRRDHHITAIAETEP